MMDDEPHGFFKGLRWALVISIGIWLALAACVKWAWSGDGVVTWTAPTQNCNGSPLTDLNGFKLRWGPQTSEVTLPATTLTYTVTGLTPGVWWFSAAATTPSAESQFVTVTKTVAPEEFVTKGTTVYTFVKNSDRVLVLPVGTVPTGVVCDATQSVNGKYVIPRSQVTWSGSVRPVVVLADCG